MKKFCFIFLSLWFLLGASLKAQRHILVFDPELRQPLKGVTITIDKQRTDTTNWLGDVVIPERFDTLVVSKTGYITLTIPQKWVEDSIPVIKKFNAVDEVVVYGNAMDNREKWGVRWTKADRIEYELNNPVTGIKFSLASLLSSRARKEKKQLRHLRNLFNRLDANNTHPIISAYRSVFDKKQNKDFSSPKSR